MTDANHTKRNANDAKKRITTMHIDFHKQAVLITGATRGIGKQLADDFARLGANLILTGTEKEEISALNKKAKGRKGAFTKCYAVDFLNTAGLDAFLKKLTSFERIDVCINNAGINTTSDIDEASTKDWDDIVAVNLTAPFKIIRAVSRAMKKNKYGRIVNIASIWSVISKPDKSIYTASKFGIRGLTVAASIDLAPHNILVNAVSPGVVMTDMSKRMLGEKGMKEWAQRVPLGRLAKPAEISKVVQFLASRENTYITGQNIVVDGGFVNV